MHRGIDLLIKAWPKTDSRAILLLRGPDNKYKAAMQVLAEQTGLLGSRIFFPKAVTESELIDAAAEADVGLIPYAPIGKTYQNCCPNKTSQYMAAGLPILANRTSFVESLVLEADCGQVINFNNPEAIATAVASLVEDAALRETLGRAGRRYFQEKFNWDIVSAPLYNALDRLTEKNASKKLQMFVSNTETNAAEEHRVNVLALSKNVMRLVPPSVRRRLAKRMRTVMVQEERSPRGGRGWTLRRLAWRLLPKSVRAQITARLSSHR